MHLKNGPSCSAKTSPVMNNPWLTLKEVTAVCSEQQTHPYTDTVIKAL
jgi:hypothetical protein